jgi:MFS family permease
VDIMANPNKARGAAEKALVLVAVCLAALAMPLTFTGPAVALPAIGRSLGGSPIALYWVTNAFMLTFGSSLMAAGALADAYGRKRMFLTGVAAFGLFSALASVSPSILWLDLARAAQGLAAALAFAGGAAALAQEFEGPGRMRAFSMLGTSFGIGLSFGPITSGLLIDAFGWTSIFLPVVAAAALSFGIAARFMRESSDPAATGLDWPGAASFTAALALLTYGFLKAPEAGWSDPAVVGLLAAAVLFFTVFGIVERRAARPMLDLSLFRYPRFVGVQLLAAAPAYAFVVLLVLLPVRFVGVEGMGEIAAGRLMIALSAPLLVLPLVAGWLTRWLPASVLCAGGLVVSAAGLFWLSGVPAGAPATALVLPMLTIGIGISLPWGLMDGLAVSVVPTERAGMATGIFNTTRVAGEGLALAVVGAVLSALTVGHLAGAGLGPSESRVAAAQRLVTGDLAAAQQLLPESGHDQLVAQYGLAFSSLLVVLTVITLVTAVVVFLFMGRKAGEEVVADVAEA